MRGALAELRTIESLRIRPAEREVTVWHSGDVSVVSRALEGLRLGAKLCETKVARELPPMAHERGQRGILRFLLALNATMFVAELVAGLYGESTGLLSDALDMLADAMVYGIALWAVGGGGRAQRTAARLSGWLQLVLGLGVLLEVGRRALMGSAPEPPVMVSMASLALAANLVCIIALARHRGDGVHMRASWIFSTNDVIANVGVIAAGGLVHWTGSAWPDFVIGTMIGLIVLQGARRILRLGKSTSA